MTDDLPHKLFLYFILTKWLDVLKIRYSERLVVICLLCLCIFTLLYH